MPRTPRIWRLLPRTKRRLDDAIAHSVQRLHDLGEHTHCGTDCPDAGTRTRPLPT